MPCGLARLGLADWVLTDDVEALTVGHAKQRALLVLDLAAGHLARGRVEAAFALARQALDTGLASRSGRIVEQARTVRRSLRTSAPPKVVRDFDERLHGACLWQEGNRHARGDHRAPGAGAGRGAAGAGHAR